MLGQRTQVAELVLRPNFNSLAWRCRSRAPLNPSRCRYQSTAKVQPQYPIHEYKQVPLVINGRDVTTKTSFTVRSPVSETDVWSCSSASSQDALDAVAAAENAFPAWSKTKPSHRRDIFLGAADLFLKRRDELAAYAHHETAATEDFVDFILAMTVDGLKDTAGRISSLHGIMPEVQDAGARAVVTREPYGVILGIAPWNNPYHLGVRAISAAIATGNTTILKGPELSPFCYWAIADIFRQAGLPDGCLNLLFHRSKDAAEVTESLIAHPAVKKINFTGSTQVGSIIASSAGKHLKPVLMELGGKANAVVMKDANLELAAKSCVVGAFLHAGQACMSTERIIVQSSIASDFTTALRRAVNQLFPKSSPNATLITSSAAKKNTALIQDALSQGATLIHPASSPSTTTETTKMPPHILSNMSQNMSLFHTESFGPSVAVYTFETEAEALALANDTEYGLASSVFSRDLQTALRVARGIEVGAVHVNSMTLHDEAALPHGGCKKSGWGRFNGAQGMEEFVWWKTVTWAD